ncbi:glycosyltransferase 61 family protein [Cognatiyoonia sp. IB215182]|uniref:glycosyltransferase 61 family protein n=1 Tax=Cognatiyoonia sp. IB215182 TaxID=3097353 RepID=UPI002A11AAFE|nr:glycosyltransferase 61 family protein [Cognatiyoonia sp. IB215182]MDX8352074.1 glycosyltransferase 61 family protein [Cognatiyoonia sp. IB215182]
MRRFYPIAAPLIARLSRSDGVLSRDILQAEEVEEVEPPFLSDTSRALVTATHPWTNPAFELELADARTATHMPVIRINHGPGIVGPDGFATRFSRQRLGNTFGKNALTARAGHAPQIAYLNDLSTHLYFGHWLKDGVPQTFLADDGHYYFSNPESWHHCTEYREILELRPRDTEYLYADEIVTFSDFAQGSLKRKRYQKMKACLADTLPAPTKDHPKVFLWRGNAGASRNFRDPQQVYDRLVADGWHMVEVTAPLATLYQALSGAQIVAGMEGSHLNHVHFCTKPGTIQIILVPHDHFNMVHLGLARAVGNTCGFCVLSGSGQDGYVMDFDAFAEAIDGTSSIQAKSKVV